MPAVRDDRQGPAIGWDMSFLAREEADATLFLRGTEWRKGRPHLYHLESVRIIRVGSLWSAEAALETIEAAAHELITRA